MLDYVCVIKFHIIIILFLSLRRRSQVFTGKHTNYHSTFINMPGGIGNRLRNRVNLCRMYVRVTEIKLALKR